MWSLACKNAHADALLRGIRRSHYTTAPTAVSFGSVLVQKGESCRYTVRLERDLREKIKKKT